MKKLMILFALLLTDNLYAQKTDRVYLEQGNQDASYYTIVYPPKTPWKGTLILVAGFGETAETVFLQTDLPQLAAQNGLLTIIPCLKTGTLSFGADSVSQQSLQDIIADVSAKHKIADLPLYTGGFSIGGSCVVKYAEAAVEKNYPVKPRKVFAIDPPLDFERFYHTALRDVRLSGPAKPNQENVYMINRIEQEMHGTPETALANYHSISPYSYSDTTQKAIRNLLSTPIRIYAEPDINWWIKERGADLSGMNVLDGAAMINELNRLGHRDATLIITENKGYRKPDNRRHPHSWSIVDNKALIDWLLAP